MKKPLSLASGRRNAARHISHIHALCFLFHNQDLLIHKILCFLSFKYNLRISFQLHLSFNFFQRRRKSYSDGQESCRRHENKGLYLQGILHRFLPHRIH